eukprot:gene15821-4775_t
MAIPNTWSWLLDCGANVDQPMHDGATPVDTASYNGHDKCMQLLLDRGAKVDQPMDDGATPLYDASHNGHTKCMERGAKVDQPKINGVTLLPQRMAIPNAWRYCSDRRLILWS